MKVLLILSAMMSIVILASNFMATKIWNLFGIPADGGLLLFPLTYIAGDMLVEIYGGKIANFIAVIAAVLNLLVILIISVTVFLPAYPGWDGQESIVYVFGFSLRITLASLTSYLFSQLTNNYVFLRIRVYQATKNNSKGLKGYKARAILSSAVGRFVDSGIFEIIAFFGVLPVVDFIKQAISAYVAGMLAELLLALTISEPILRKIKHFITQNQRETIKAEAVKETVDNEESDIVLIE